MPQSVDTNRCVSGYLSGHMFKVNGEWDGEEGSRSLWREWTIFNIVTEKEKAIMNNNIKIFLEYLKVIYYL